MCGVCEVRTCADWLAGAGAQNSPPCFRNKCATRVHARLHISAAARMRMPDCGVRLRVGEPTRSAGEVQQSQQRAALPAGASGLRCHWSLEFVAQPGCGADVHGKHGWAARLLRAPCTRSVRACARSPPVQERQLWLVGPGWRRMC